MWLVLRLVHQSVATGHQPLDSRRASFRGGVPVGPPPELPLLASCLQLLQSPLFTPKPL